MATFHSTTSTPSTDGRPGWAACEDRQEADRHIKLYLDIEEEKLYPEI